MSQALSRPTATAQDNLVKLGVRRKAVKPSQLSRPSHRPSIIPFVEPLPIPIPDEVACPESRLIRMEEESNARRRKRSLSKWYLQSYAAAGTAMATELLLVVVVMFTSVSGGCPFQNPFWFVDRPRVEAVTPRSSSENGTSFLPRVRLMWGRIENFKCVDYFYVEYFQRRDPAGTARRSSRIARDRRSLEIEVRLRY